MKLIEALKSYEQADMDGVMVLVSRQACDEAANTIASLTEEVERQRETIDVLESNARQQAFLLADTGRRASSAEAQVERLRAALARADSEAERGQNGSAAHAQGQLTAVRIILRTALQSTEGDGR